MYIYIYIYILLPQLLSFGKCLLHANLLIYKPPRYQLYYLQSVAMDGETE